MPQEIERKYLVRDDRWRALAEPMEIRQGYLARESNCVVRVRIAGAQGWITVKSRVVGITRSEFEYEVPLDQATEMLETLCPKPVMEKRRSRIKAGGVVWEVDEFLGANRGLVVAEVELTSENQVVDLPDWIGEEVTGDARYYNSNLLLNPFTSWPR